MTIAIAIRGLGHHVPERCVTSAELEARLALPEGWIARRTGIEERRYAAENEALSDLAVRAGENALASAGISKRDVALVLLATSTPDHLLPPTAPLLAHRLGLPAAGGIDLAGACAGFIYALTLGAGFAQAQNAPVLIVAANILSRRINAADRNTSILFSDGAGAAVIAPSPSPGSGILGTYLTSDGGDYGRIQIPAGGSRTPFDTERDATDLLMVIDDGKAVFAKAVGMMSAAAREAMARAGVGAGDIDHFIPHQANARMMTAVADQLAIPHARMRSTIAAYGNSSAATIPLTLSATAVTHPIKRGDIVLMTAAGAGLTGGAIVMRW